MNRFKNIFFGIVFGIALLGSQVAGHSQSRHLTAANLGLGGGGTAYIDGFHANFINPANLMINEGVKPRFSLGLSGVSTNAGGSLLNIGVYNQYFTEGLTITGQVADDALGAWFGNDAANMRKAGMQIDFVPVGMAYRSDSWAASVAVRTRALVNFETSRGFAELAINGFDTETFSDPTPVNLTMETMAFYETSFGFSKTMLEMDNLFGFAENIKIYAGIAPKLLIGAQTSRLNFESTLQIETDNNGYAERLIHDFAYQFETTGSLAGQLTDFYNARQGSGNPKLGDYVEDPVAEDFYDVKAMGWGFDLGGTIEMDVNLPFLGSFAKGTEKLRVGLSLTDIGKVTFNDQVGRFTADEVMTIDGFDVDEDFDAYSDSVANEIYGSLEPQDVEGFSRPLPSMINLGGQLVMNKLSVALDFGKGFSYQGTNSKRLSMAAGVEYRLLGFLPFRVGMRTGGASSTSYSAGFGIEFRNLEFSLAASTVANSTNYGTNLGAAWSGLVLRF